MNNIYNGFRLTYKLRNFILSNFYSFFLNLVLFTVLMIGIQNNHEKKSIDFLILKTIDLPIGFIVGSSFILGSLSGSIFYSIIKTGDIN